jgi:hypothetical protein
LVLSQTITYAPSASALYLANAAKRQSAQQAFLGVGDIPYEQNAELTKIATMRGYISGPLVNLPASKEEILSAQAATHSDGHSVSHREPFRKPDLAAYP